MTRSRSKWYELRERQKKERIEQVTTLARARLTQTQAAQELGVTLQTLNRFIQLNGIIWPVVKQGVKTDAKPTNKRSVRN